jgi:hypothetical protein
MQHIRPSVQIDGYALGFFRRNVGGFGCQKIEIVARHKVDKPVVPVEAVRVGGVVHRGDRGGGGDLVAGSKSVPFAATKI